MKRAAIVLHLVVALLVSASVMSQQLTFKMDNPRIIRKNNKQWFQFEVYAKASDTGTYLYATQLAIWVDNSSNFITSPLNNIDVDLSTGILGGFYYGIAEYTYVRNWGMPPTSFGIAIKSNISLLGSDPYDVCAKITTEFQRIVSIGIEIANPTGGVTGMAGVAFYPQNMPAGPGMVQSYSLPGIPLPTHYDYAAPNLFEGYDCREVYLSRIYSKAFGWSQFGGTVNNVQYVNWADAVNTSVWDTGGTINTTGAKMNKLRVHKGGRLMITPANTLTCTDSVEINEPDGLWISSNYYGTASFLDAGVVTYGNNGSAMVERYLKQDQKHLYTIPVASTTTRPFLSQQLAMKWYDEPNHLYRTVVNPSMDSILNSQMLGYSVYSSSALTNQSTLQVDGSMITGPLILPLGNHIGPEGPDGWNLIGNPYVSAIDWLSPSFQLTQVDPTIYVFHPETGNYYFWNRHDQLHTTGASSILAAEQGFYLHATVPGSLDGSIYLDNGARLHSNQAFYKSVTQMTDYLFLTATGNGFQDETQVRFDPSSTSLFDFEHDAYKREGAEGAPQLYSILQDSTQVALNTLPFGGSNLIIPLGFHCTLGGTYLLEASNMESFAPGSEIWLEDLKTGVYQFLPDHPAYSFSYMPTDNPVRFHLHFANPWIGIRDPVTQGIRVYSSGKDLYVRQFVKVPCNGMIRLFDMLGREVFNGQVREVSLNQFHPGVKEGYYTARVTAGGIFINKKVYLK